ncbi:MAG TPA: TetR family transcriptional regulator C-terminal domain-containing protein, partial [Ilumatobacteraceae bacterium]
ALTQRFGSKRALLLGFAERSARSTVAVFERARDRATDAATAIVDGLVDLVRPIDSRTALANNLAMLHLDLVDPELGAHARAQSRAFRAELVALIGDGVRDASLRDVDPATLADTLATVYNGALITWAIDGDGRLDEWLRTRLERALEPFRA